MKDLKKALPIINIAAAVLGILVIIFCALKAYVFTSNVLGDYSKTMYDFIFGFKNSNGDVVQGANPGLVIAFVLTLLATLAMIAVVCLGYFIKGFSPMIKAILGCFSFAAFISAAVIFFTALHLVDYTTGSSEFLGMTGTAKAGAGVYLTGIFGILAGLCCCPVAVMPFLKK